jgi:hypothetical protein
MREKKSSSDKTQRSNGHTKTSKRTENPSGHSRQSSGNPSGTTGGSSKSENR